MVAYAACSFSGCINTISVVCGFMDKIKPEKGFLHIVVSRENDDKYYTGEYLCLGFRKFIFKSLCESGFDTVFFLDGDGEKCSIICTNDLSLRYYEKFGKERGGWFSLFKSSNKKEDLENASVSFKENIIQTDGSYEEVLRIVCNLMKKRKTAVVISVGLLYSVMKGENRKLIDDLSSIENCGSDSVLVISVNADMNKSERFLFPVDNIKESVLTAKIFPDAVRKTINDNKGYYFIWSSLLRAMNQRVVFLNKFDLEDYRNIVMHYFLSERSPSDPEFDLIEWFSIILWANARIPWLKYQWSLTSNIYDEELDIAVRAKDIEDSLRRKALFEKMISVSQRLSDEYGNPDRFYRQCKLSVEAPDTESVYSEKIKNDVSCFRDIIKQCFEKTDLNDVRFIPWECFAAMNSIEDRLRRYVYIQHQDYNAKDAFYGYFSILRRGIKHSDSNVLSKLIQEKSLFDIVDRALENYFEYVDSFNGGIGEESNQRERKLEIMFGEVINLVFEISNCQCRIIMLKKQPESFDSSGTDSRIHKEETRLIELKELSNNSMECIAQLRRGNRPEETDCDILIERLKNIEEFNYSIGVL